MPTISLIASSAWIDADDARQHTQDAGLGAARGELGGRGLGEHVAVGRALLGVEHRDVTLEAEDRAVDDGNAELHRGVVEHVADREVVGAVDHQVELRDDVGHVRGVEPDVVGDDVHVGVEQRQRLLGRVDLALADPVDVVEDLALEVGVVDHVHVDDADRAHTGGGQVERGGRTETTGAEQQDLGAEQLLLALLADLGEEQVAAVAVALLRGEDLGRAPVRGPRPSSG